MPFSPTYQVPENRRAYTLLAGPVGCLMLHGFMGSPISSYPLAQYLAERQISVHCPLLPGHGEFPNKLHRVEKEAWIAEAEEALGFLKQHCREIVLMGHSMGTVLGADLVTRYGNFSGFVMLAPAYDVPSRAINFMPFLRHAITWFYPLRLKRLHPLVYERIRDFNPDIDLDDPQVQARLPQMSRVPTDAIDEMRQMLKYGRTLWPQLDLPVVLFQGRQDIAVGEESTRRLFDQLPNPDKELVLFDNAGHELMRPFEPVHQEVWVKVYDFIVAHSSLPDSRQFPK
jgi:carboxylesterase